MGFDANARSQSGVGTNLGILEEAARSLRRLESDDAPDAAGMRLVWHRGRRVELLSWESAHEQVETQELTFFGYVVTHRRGQGVKTGRLPEAVVTGPGGLPATHMVAMDAAPNPRALDYASHLLRHVAARDYYAQHFLKQVNNMIVSQGFDNVRTGARSDMYRRPSDAELPRRDGGWWQRFRRLVGRT
jgi:hypothetical protein